MTKNKTANTENNYNTAHNKSNYSMYWVIVIIGGQCVLSEFDFLNIICTVTVSIPFDRDFSIRKQVTI